MKSGGSIKGGYDHHGHGREPAKKGEKENWLLELCQEGKGTGAYQFRMGVRVCCSLGGFGGKERRGGLH